jgi:hypothetical protein
MKHHLDIQQDFISIAYSWKFGQTWHTFSLKADPAPKEIKPNSEEEFITEHYWGYTPINDKTCSEYGVEHPRWMTYQVNEHQIDVAFDKVYGKKFSFLSSQTPESVMLAEGSEIIVRSMKKIF